MNTRVRTSANYDFSDQTVIVTGAGGGIGRATANLFHSLGANVVAGDVQFAEEEAQQSPRILRQIYDAANPEDAGQLVDIAQKRFGAVNHLVLCAGIYETVPAPEISDAQWRRMMAVNLDGVFFLIQRASPLMVDGGAIIALASIAAHQGGSFHHAHYGASKGGVLALVRGLARDLGPRLRVNAISPGTIDTPMVSRRVAEGGEALLQTIPLKRLGRPDEIAKVCAFLCSDDASYVTGETLIVSGGLYMG